MIFIAYFIFIFSVLQLIIAAINTLFNQRIKKTDKNNYGLISVLIPARNEEKNIGKILDDLLNQDYQNIEIIVFDDMSTDGTAGTVTEYSKLDKRLKLIESKGIPGGWLGKNYACHTLSKHATGKYLLFLDADVRISGSILLNAISYFEKYKLVSCHL